MSEPELTVGLPVRDDADGLRRTVPSLFSQTWPGRVRLLVVDDGSRDDTPAALAELTARYPDLEVVRTELPRGPAHARNAVLERAGDGYLAFAASHTVWHPRKLEHQFRTLRADPGPEPMVCAAPARVHRGAQRHLEVPPDADDQIRELLEDRWPVRLSSWLARTSTFRAVEGGFDERLQLWHDVEFALRLFDAGGRVLRAGDDALVTVLVEGHAPAAAVVAEECRTLDEALAEHEARYGRRYALARRRDRRETAAAAHASSGDHARAATYRARARGLDTVLWVAAARARLTGRGDGPTPSEATATAPPAASSSPAPPANAGPLTLARAALRDGRLDEVLRLLDPSSTDVMPPAAWFVRSEAQRRSGDRDAALATLLAGIEAHPQDRELRVRLAEYHVTRRAWHDALDAWTEVSQDTGHHTRRTYRLLARAHAEAGDHVGARAVALRGLSRWPDDVWIRDELHGALAACTAWEDACRVPASRWAVLDPDAPTGNVDDLGVLRGGDGPVRGTVTGDTGNAPVVQLEVNGTVVASTHAATSGPDSVHGVFQLSCTDLLRYLGDGDVVTVRCEDRPLQLIGTGPRAVFCTGYASRSGELLDRVARGHVFTKFGELKPGHTADRTARTVAAYRELAEVVTRTLGLATYPIYGNLLGTIRDHDQIVHDVGGFDVAYISRRTEAVEVRREFLEVCYALLDEGYHLRLDPWGAMALRGPDDDVAIDLNYGWFSSDGELQLSYGWRFEPVRDEGALRAPRTGVLDGHLLPVPGNAEAVLEQIYGTWWPVPDQGFDVAAQLQRAPDHLLTTEELERVGAEAPRQVRIMSTIGPDGEERPRER